MPERNQVQAMVPTRLRGVTQRFRNGARACGIREQSYFLLCMLPGVPHEMKGIDRTVPLAPYQARMHASSPPPNVPCIHLALGNPTLQELSWRYQYLAPGRIQACLSTRAWEAFGLRITTR